MTAVELARQILMQSGNSLHELGRQKLNDLIRIRGIGPAKGITLLAALELGRRREASQQAEKTPVKSSESVFRFFHPLLGDLDHEEFWLLKNPRRSPSSKRSWRSTTQSRQSRCGLRYWMARS